MSAHRRPDLLVWLAMLAGLVLGACASAPPGTPQATLKAMHERPDRLIVVAVANPQGVISLAAGSTSATYSSVQPYLGHAHARRALEAIVHEFGLTERAAWPIRALQLHCAVFELPFGASREAVVAALSRDPRVEIAQPLHRFDTLGAAAYNDPYAPLQRALVELQAEQAHLASRGRGVSVAVVDTGADVAHPDLQGRISSARNLVDDDGVQFSRDRHGTEVAGVIAAVANNHRGIVGIAPESTLHLYKACWQQEGGGARCNSFTLALALAASLEDGAPIINLSLAGPHDPLLARLLRHALAQGRLVVAAAPTSGALDGFPVGVAGVIAVDSTGGLQRSGVLHAPGRDILTTVPGGHYDFGSGSSLAAAHVSGIVALLLAASDAPRPAAVRGLLEASRQHGTGPVSACNAIAALRAQAQGCVSEPDR